MYNLLGGKMLKRSFLRKIFSIVLILIFIFSFCQNKLYASDIDTFKDIQYDKIEKQNYPLNCGLAAMSSILNYFYSIETDQEKLQKILIKIEGGNEKIDLLKKKIDEQKGLTMLDMKKILDKKNIVGKGFKGDYKELQNFMKDFYAPVIIHEKVDYYGEKEVGHFSLILGFFENRVLILDPAYGNVSYKKEEFLNRWTGKIFIIYPPEENYKDIIAKSENRLNKKTKRCIKKLRRLKLYEKL